MCSKLATFPHIHWVFLKLPYFETQKQIGVIDNINQPHAQVVMDVWVLTSFRFRFLINDFGKKAMWVIRNWIRTNMVHHGTFNGPNSSNGQYSVLLWFLISFNIGPTYMWCFSKTWSDRETTHNFVGFFYVFRTEWMGEIIFRKISISLNTEHNL